MQLEQSESDARTWTRTWTLIQVQIRLCIHLLIRMHERTRSRIEVWDATFAAGSGRSCGF